MNFADVDIDEAKPPFRRRLALVASICLSALFLGLALFVFSPAFAQPGKVRLVLSVRPVSAVYDGNAHASDGFVGESEDGSVPVVADDGKTYVVSGLSTVGSVTRPSESIGAIPVVGKAHVEDADGHDVTEQVDLDVEDAGLTIEPRPLSVSSADLSKVFDGKPLENGKSELASVNGLVDGDSVSCDFTGSQTVPGKSENAFEVSVSGRCDDSCYAVEETFGSLDVRPRDKGGRLPLEIVGESSEVVMDGAEHTHSSLSSGEFPFDVDGVAYVATGIECKPATGVRAGTYESPISAGKDFGIYLASDTARESNLASQFDVKFSAGSLSIVRGDVYVATFFGSDDDWTDSVYVSDDLETFRKVSVASNEMRDPSIIWHDGRFWCMTCRNDEDGHVWLDLSSSVDLVSWSEATCNGPFELDKLPRRGGDAYDVVAPEWFVDSGKFYVIISCGWWGGCHGAPTDDYMEAYLLEVSAPRFSGGRNTISGIGPARNMSVNADGADRIDGTIDFADGKYWLTIKKNGLTMETWENSSVSAGGWKLVSPKCLYGFEAPCVVSSNGRLSLFADGVPDVEPYGVKRWTSAGFGREWEPAPVRFLDEEGHFVPVVRHGTVLVVGRESKAAHSAISRLLP